jgi:hypothetical protein
MWFCGKFGLSPSNHDPHPLTTTRNVCNYALKDVEIASSFSAGYSFDRVAIPSNQQWQQSTRTPMLNEDEEQSSDGLDNNSSDDEKLFQPNEDSEYDLDEDTLDDTKIEALFAPATLAAVSLRWGSHKADFKAVKKLMAKRKWSLRHIVLLYTGFGGRPRGSRGLPCLAIVSHALPDRKEIRDSILW